MLWVGSMSCSSAGMGWQGEKDWFFIQAPITHSEGPGTKGPMGTQSIPQQAGTDHSRECLWSSYTTPFYPSFPNRRACFSAVFVQE